jgi:hypothetical protein
MSRGLGTLQKAILEALPTAPELRPCLEALYARPEDFPDLDAYALASAALSFRLSGPLRAGHAGELAAVVTDDDGENSRRNVNRALDGLRRRGLVGGVTAQAVVFPAADGEFVIRVAGKQSYWYTLAVKPAGRPKKGDSTVTLSSIEGAASLRFMSGRIMPSSSSSSKRRSERRVK